MIVSSQPDWRFLSAYRRDHLGLVAQSPAQWLPAEARTGPVGMLQASTFRFAARRSSIKFLMTAAAALVTVNADAKSCGGGSRHRLGQRNDPIPMSRTIAPGALGAATQRAPSFIRLTA
jgi:hypothetical protein